MAVTTSIYPFSIIGEGVRFGERCVVGTHCWIGDDVIMGDDVRLQTGVFLPRGTIIGDRVFIGPHVVLTDDKHPRVNNPGYDAKPPILEHDCNIGAAAVILPGVTIGAGATVAAGAVVTKDIRAGEVFYG
jgi:UDP-2-acetamido-3-amino-2,3-dideoxy-glucuronate N-acetyltransferase